MARRGSYWVLRERGRNIKPISHYPFRSYRTPADIQSDIPKTLLAGTFGLAVQALVTGSVLQLVHRYFIRQKRSFLRTGIQDPPLARVGVVWLTALICLHVVVVNVINTRVVLMSQQFTAGYLMDFVSFRLGSRRVGQGFRSNGHEESQLTLSGCMDASCLS